MKKIIAVISMCVMMMCSLSACGLKQKDTSVEKVINITQMKAICELATLECYYHNVAKVSKEKDVLWWDTKAELWIEYSGIVKVGVDISDLDLEVNGEVVNITMPKAAVLSCEVDETKLNKDSYIMIREGLGAEKITADDQTLAFQTAQDSMREAAETDEELISQAQQRAEDLLESYINNVGDILGKKYTISWNII